tara:strand:+ start:4463 stop:4897 length:435 start_codon:yes stop_codon:yes gene_type:complete
MILKNCLDSIFHRRNYKFLIVFLSAILLLFLFCGNYDLIEGLTLNDESAKLNNINSKTKKSTANSKAISKHYKDSKNMRGNILKRNLGTMVEPFTEGMNKCGSNYSNLGVKGNTANIMVNSQCETLEGLKNKNNSLLEDTRNKK